MASRWALADIANELPVGDFPSRRLAVFSFQPRGRVHRPLQYDESLARRSRSAMR